MLKRTPRVLFWMLMAFGIATLGLACAGSDVEPTDAAVDTMTQG
jgi:hypothetical protein